MRFVLYSFIYILEWLSVILYESTKHLVYSLIYVAQFFCLIAIYSISSIRSSKLTSSAFTIATI